MPSFALNQEIMNLEDQQTKGDKTVAARLKICYAQRTEEAAAAAAVAEKKANAAAAQDAKQQKKMRSSGGGAQVKEVHSGSLLNCRDCETDFFFSDKESAFFTEKGLSAPTRCYPCRQEKKAQRQTDGPRPKRIACCDCQTEFIHSIGAQQHYEENGWSVPLRCISCRSAKKAQKLMAFPINCKDCHTDFVFSVGSQIYFKEKGWDAPSRCAGCRKTNKAKAVEAAASAASAESAAGGISAQELIAAARVMVNGDGTYNVEDETNDGPELDQDDLNKEQVRMMRNE